MTSRPFHVKANHCVALGVEHDSTHSSAVDNDPVILDPRWNTLEHRGTEIVPLGILVFSEQKSLAQQFVDFVVSEQGKAIFRKHHYRVDPPAGIAF